MRRLAFAVLLAATPAAAQPAELTKEFQAGVDAFRLGKFDEARAHLEKAREIDPKLPGPYRFLSAVAQAQGRWADCIESAHQAIAINPRSSEVADTKKIYDECRTSAGRAPHPRGVGGQAAVPGAANVSRPAGQINELTPGATP